MIIKNNSTRLIVTLSFLLILPYVQKQWFNLYLFNVNNISFYSILYYLSGIICPSLITLNSLNNFTDYKFNNYKINSKNIIKGKALFFLVAITLIFLSYLITDYLYINFDIINNLFFEGIKLQQPNFSQLSFIIFFISILLIFKKSRIFLKKLILVNFMLISFLIWHLQISNIRIDNQFHIYKYYSIDNISLINVFILIFIEIAYFTWSFISYKNNLSDWKINIPEKVNVTSFLKIFTFYSFIIIYYSILD